MIQSAYGHHFLGLEAALAELKRPRGDAPARDILASAGIGWPADQAEWGRLAKSLGVAADVTTESGRMTVALRAFRASKGGRKGIPPACPATTPPPPAEQEKTSETTGRRTKREDATERIRTYHASLTENQKKNKTVRDYMRAGNCCIGLASGILNDLDIQTKGKKKKGTTGKPRTVPGGNDVLAVLPSGSMGDCTQEQIEAVRNAIEKHGLETLVEVVELYATQPDRDVKAPRSRTFMNAAGTDCPSFPADFIFPP